MKDAYCLISSKNESMALLPLGFGPLGGGGGDGALTGIGFGCDLSATDLVSNR